MKRKTKAIIASMVMTGMLMITACGKSDKESGAYSKNSSVASDRAASSSDKSNSGTALDSVAKEKNSTTADTQKVNQDAVNRKVISKLYREIETKDFDQAMEVINNRALSVGGYIEDSNIKGSGLKKDDKKDLRKGELVVRIPSDKISEYIKDVEAVGVILNSKQEGEDITFQYYDTEARVKTLKIQEERLLSLLSKTNDLQSMIDLEKRLSDLRIEIESLTTTLKKYDNLVSLATVNITIREVEEVTKEEEKEKEKEKTFTGSVADSFSSSVKALTNLLKSIVVILAALLPFVVVLLIIAVPAIIIVKKRKKKKENDRLQK